MLQYARTFNNPPAVATAGLGALQKEELETRRKTNRQFAEALKRYAPRTASSVDGEMPMELDAMLGAEEEDEEEYEEGSEEEADDALFFMEPDHDKIRAQEDLKTQDYCEAGITTDTINVLKQGTWIIPRRPATTVIARGILKQIAWPRKVGCQTMD